MVFKLDTGKSGVAELFAVIVLIALSGCVALSTTSPTAVNLTGVWRLDVAASDAVLPLVVPKPIAKSAMRVPPPNSMNAVQSTLAAQELDIQQREGAMRIDYDQKALVVYRWGKDLRESPGVAAGWQGRGFVIRLDQGRGDDLTRSFTLSDDKQRLLVVTDVGGRSFVTIQPDLL
ncbi:MAG: hypothetical protein O3A73_14460 [Proteobacteria bacterium]|nr:hypothetical protein [Pseudomonadota bacterium]